MFVNLILMYNSIFLYLNLNFGSGALKVLPIKIIEDNKIDAYFK